MIKYYLGADPGNNGAWAAITPEGLQVLPMPTIEVGKISKKNFVDASAIKSWLMNFPPQCTKVVIEQVGAMPGQGVTSMFTFGKGLGILQGLMVGMGYAYQMIRPQEWQKILAGQSEQSFCSHLFPGVDFRASERCRKPHEGMIDAACIAEYCRRIG